MAHQISLLDQALPFRYAIDCCAIFSQKENRHHRRAVYSGLWEQIEKLMQSKSIVIASEIFEEIKDKNIETWIRKNQCVIIPVDENIQNYVTDVVQQYPKLIDFVQNKSSGDAFLIATAMEFNLTIITEENKDSSNKIPKVAQGMGVKAINIDDLCEIEGWRFI